METADLADGCYANRLRAAARAISRHYDATLRPLDLKISQLSVLVAASISDGHLTIAGLAERLAMDRSTLSRNFDPLERRGLVALGPETRHRARHVHITAQGAALVEAAKPLWEKAQAEIAAIAPDIPQTTTRLAALTHHFG